MVNVHSTESAALFTCEVRIKQSKRLRVVHERQWGVLHKVCLKPEDYREPRKKKLRDIRIILIYSKEYINDGINRVTRRML
jgi:hypothetical protein